MDSLLNSVLGPYFQVLFKNFKKQNLSVNVFDGFTQGQSNLNMNDLDFSEQVIQEILLIPPQLEVQSAKIAALNVMVPWSNLKREPIVFTVDRIDILVTEPRVAKPMPHIWSSFMAEQLKSKKNKKSEDSKKGSDVLSSLKIVVKEFHLRFKPLNGSCLSLDIANVVVQSTNSEWKAVDLSMAHTIDKANNREHAYKEIRADAVSMSLEQDGRVEVILSQVPATVHMISTTTADAAETWISLNIDVFLEELNFSWNHVSWTMMLNFGVALVTCFQRDTAALVPVPVEKSEPGPDIFVHINIDRWALELRHEETGQGFSFFGFGFRFSVSPEARITLKDHVGKEFPGKESFVQASVSSFTFRELIVPKDKDPRFTRLVSQAALPQGMGGNEEIFTIRVSSKKTLTDELKALELMLTLSGIQIVLDHEVWDNLYTFASIRPSITVPESAVAASSPAPADPNAPTGKPFSLKSLLKRSTVFVQAKNTHFVIPADPKSPKFGNKSLFFGIGKILVNSQPEWKVLPLLSEAVKSLPFSAEALAFTQLVLDPSHRIQAEVQDVCVDVIDTNDQHEALLKPTSLRVHGRYGKIKNQTSDGPVYQAEATLSWGHMHVHLTKTNYLYFKTLHERYTEFAKKVLFHGLDSDMSTKEKLKEKIETKAEGQTDSAAVAATILSKVEGSKLSAVEYTLNVFRTAVFFRADGGTFELPLALFNSPNEEAASDTLTSFGFTNLELLASNAGSVQTVMLRLGSIGAAEIDHPTVPVIFTLTPGGADAVSHPQLFSRDQNYTFHVYMLRSAPTTPATPATPSPNPQHKPLPPTPGQQHKPLPPPPGKKAAASAAGLQTGSEISLRLQGTKVAVRKRKPPTDAPPELQDPASSESPAALAERYLTSLMPVVEDGLKKFIAGASSHEEQVNKGLDLAKKGLEYLDIHWHVEFGDCDFTLFESDNPTRPRASFKIASMNRETISNTFTQLEDGLIATKMALAMAEAEKEQMNSRIAELLEAVNKAKTDHAVAISTAKNDQAVLEQVLITTKLKLAESESALQAARGGKKK